jgi:hypothetical protein
MFSLERNTIELGAARKQPISADENEGRRASLSPSRAFLSSCAGWIVQLVLSLTSGLLEISNGLAQRTSQFRKFLWPKNDQHNS